MALAKKRNFYVKMYQKQNVIILDSFQNINSTKLQLQIYDSHSNIYHTTHYRKKLKKNIDFYDAGKILEKNISFIKW